ncbi:MULTISPECIES: DNA translocase FtsK [Marinobacter]|uniref:DNA translocase FtsK n=1 Tax=Marinobacter xiaoshiensis TaxID=3073652 RepID=A0ABU2HIL8_9GAMM|nr:MULTISPECIES: DNA translocase FtsK [unclassified Marinobacter]MBK1886018.1 DNA translocase FtsK 4TM domain-containing protein [Marinobacter sp. DY40_1A1]MDS1310466.1 DNA translocase FtsK 4TM domain-containing protein [Marinobacter sp. F60267]
MAESAKAKQSPQKLTEKQLRFRRLAAQGAREGAVIGLIALCIYLAMALVTFSPSDPGWASIGHDTSVLNAAGRSGAWLASLLMDFFGHVAYLFPMMVAGYAIMLIRRRNDSLDMHWPLFLMRFGGFLLILLSATSLLSLYSVFGLGASSGGVLGTAVSDAMIRFFNLPATTLLLIAIFLFALTVTVGLSWFWLMDQLGGLALRLGQYLKKLVQSDKTKPALEKPAQPEQSPVAQKPQPAARISQPDNNVARDKSGKRWWHSIPGFGPAKASKPKARHSERQEPAIEGFSASEDPEPARLESFSSRDDAPAKGRSQSLDPNKEKAAPPAGGRSLKISPFKKNEQPPLANSAKNSQASLLEDIESPIPPISLLDPPEEHKESGYSEEALEHMSRLLEEKLSDFGVSVEVVEVNPGPVITRFEIKPAAGVKVSKISNLAKDLARSLAVLSVRVVEVIPGKSVVGIEIPNEKREIVRLSEVLGSRVFKESSSALTMALGNDIGGNPMVANLAKMPHLLVAGTTGSGKSVGVNAMLLSMLLKAGPEDVRFIMVDPKMLELSIYDGIPHLLAPVVTDMKEAANALRWCVAEMERRYRLMSTQGVRNLAGYNLKVKEAAAAGEPLLDPLWKPDEYLADDEQQRPELEHLPLIVVVIDEFADMMMIVGKKVEELIARIAQKARAAGIHLILATQRPSVDVITGLIKANIPTRISFQVSSKIDSRTVLDQGGAEQLLGHGDMLYLPPGSGLPVRVHGAFVDDDEVHRVVSAWKARGEPVYVDDVLNGAEGEHLPGVPTLSEGGDNEGDALFDEAVAFVTEGRRVSISSVQRKFKIGYNRAANLVEAMEASGVVSSAGHNGAREVLAPPPPRD